MAYRHTTSRLSSTCTLGLSIISSLFRKDVIMWTSVYRLGFGHACTTYSLQPGSYQFVYHAAPREYLCNGLFLHELTIGSQRLRGENDPGGTVHPLGQSPTATDHRVASWPNSTRGYGNRSLLYSPLDWKSPKHCTLPSGPRQ
jgi:hypothetical protein